MTDADKVVAIVCANEAAWGQVVWKELLINPIRPVRCMLVAGLRPRARTAW